MWSPALVGKTNLSIGSLFFSWSRPLVRWGTPPRQLPSQLVQVTHFGGISFLYAVKGVRSPAFRTRLIKSLCQRLPKHTKQHGCQPVQAWRGILKISPRKPPNTLMKLRLLVSSSDKLLWIKLKFSMQQHWSEKQLHRNKRRKQALVLCLCVCLVTTQLHFRPGPISPRVHVKISITLPRVGEVPLPFKQTLSTVQNAD